MGLRAGVLGFWVLGVGGWGFGVWGFGLMLFCYFLQSLQRSSMRFIHYECDEQPDYRPCPPTP